jgi:hypothetical protein
MFVIMGWVASWTDGWINGWMETTGGIGRGDRYGTLQTVSDVVDSGSKMNPSPALSFLNPFLSAMFKSERAIKGSP